MKKIFSFFAFVAIMISFAACKNGGNEPESDIVINPNSTNGMMPGRFTVDASGTQVQFSQGNLQYNDNRGEDGTWKFATHQWDTIGKANANIAEDYNGWIDLFAWGTGKKPTSTSPAGTFSEWGENAIANGGNNIHQWRTLTHNEWRYLFRFRDDAENLFGLGSVAGVNGVIILPDDWKMPIEVPGFKPAKNYMTWNDSFDSYRNGNLNNYEQNTYTAKHWDVMEKEGAIFLPAAGYCQNSIINVGTEGRYWTGTTTSTMIMIIDRGSLTPCVASGKNYRLSVRLVR